MGDKRRTKWLVQVAGDLSAHMESSMASSCKGNPSQLWRVPVVSLKMNPYNLTLLLKRDFRRQRLLQTTLNLYWPLKTAPLSTKLSVRTELGDIGGPEDNISKSIWAYLSCCRMQIENILIQDGSLQAVYDALKEAFPSRFSTVSPATVEIHTTMDLLTNNLVRVQLTEDTRSERDCLPPLPTSMAYILMLMDAGYFELELFTAIDDQGGYFICN